MAHVGTHGKICGDSVNLGRGTLAPLPGPGTSFRDPGGGISPFAEQLPVSWNQSSKVVVKMNVRGFTMRKVCGSPFG